VGDDNLALHANDTLAERCSFGTGHGTSIGSLGMGTFLQNITVRDSSYKGTAQALRIKADTQSSGFLRDVTFSNLSMQGCGTTVSLLSNYPSGGASQSTLAISNILFKDITAAGSGTAGTLMCSPRAPCQQLQFDNVQHTAPLPQKGWSCQNAHGSTAGTVSPVLSCLQ
jgi:polygalacturonase